MLFDLAIGGHHPTYIRHIVRFWRDNECQGILSIVVAPEFFHKHGDVVRLKNDSIFFIGISPEENNQLLQSKNFFQRLFREWNLHCDYAKTTQATASLLMYFDHLQFPIVFGRRSPCPFLGIYFRPTFHYKKFANHLPTSKDKWRGWRQKKLLSLALKNKKLSGVLSLDRYAVSDIAKLSSDKDKIHHLPDPVSTKVVIDKAEASEFRKRLGIDEHRKIFLLFGRLDERKGTLKVLQALNLLSSETATQCCLLLAGEIPAHKESRIRADVTALSRTTPVQIVVSSGYCLESEVPLYFSIADVVLGTYQQHVGMSGILLLASAMRKPVISSNYGLMGELVREYKMGVAVDTTNPSLIAQAMTDLMTVSIGSLFDLDKMGELAQEHTIDDFLETIFERVSLAICA